VDAAAPVETCPRCGTFAPLVDTGLRRVCAPCVEPSLHPIQRAGGDAVKWIAGFWRVLVEFGWLNLVLVAALILPWRLYSPTAPSSWALFLLTYLSVMSLAEAATFLVWRDRTLRRRPVQWAALVPGVARVWVVNLVLGAFSSLCAPVAFVLGPVSSAVALAVLEGRGVLDAVTTAWRRSEGQRAILVVLYLMTLVPVMLLTALAVTGTAVWMMRVGGSRPREVIPPAAIAALIGMSVGLLPAVVMQAAVWLATLPVHRPSEPPRGPS
jgi:hypothetical protein